MLQILERQRKYFGVILSDEHTSRQDCMGFGNIKCLTKIFTCLDSFQLEVWPVAG